MHWANREGYAGPLVTIAGSGINWTGPRREWPNEVEVHIGYGWPDTRTYAMFYGLWEDALPHLAEINRFLAEHNLPEAKPNDGHTRLSCDGFDTRRFHDQREAEYSASRIRCEASLLLGYRRDGHDCPRRQTLEQIASTGIADGFLLYPQDIAEFLAAIA